MWTDGGTVVRTAASQLQWPRLDSSLGDCVEFARFHMSVWVSSACSSFLSRSKDVLTKYGTLLTLSWTWWHHIGEESPRWKWHLDSAFRCYLWVTSLVWLSNVICFQLHHWLGVSELSGMWWSFWGERHKCSTLFPAITLFPEIKRSKCALQNIFRERPERQILHRERTWPFHSKERCIYFQLKN